MLTVLPPNIGFAAVGVPNAVLVAAEVAEPPKIFVFCCGDADDTELAPKILAVVLVADIVLALWNKNQNKSCTDYPLINFKGMNGKFATSLNLRGGT